HGEGLPRAGDTQQGLAPIAARETLNQRLDRLRLITGRAKRTQQLETRAHIWSGQNCISIMLLRFHGAARHGARIPPRSSSVKPPQSSDRPASRRRKNEARKAAGRCGNISCIDRAEAAPLLYAPFCTSPVAQPVEQAAVNRLVGGSSSSRGATLSSVADPPACESHRKPASLLHITPKRGRLRLSRDHSAKP